MERDNSVTEIRILDKAHHCRGGGRVERAQVGDPLELHFTILDLESPYEIFVRELIAKVLDEKTKSKLI